MTQQHPDNVDEALEEVIDKLGQASANAKSLRTSVEDLHRARRFDHFLLIALLAIVVALTFIAIGNRDNGKIARANGTYLINCTTPGTPRHPHSCYIKSLLAQRHAVAQLIHAEQAGHDQQTAEIIKLLTGKSVTAQQLDSARPTTTTTRARATTTPTTSPSQPSSSPPSPSPTTTQPPSPPTSTCIANVCLKGTP